jgi:hypothetical protein
MTTNQYHSKFWNWKGWDYIKWPFAAILLGMILFIIWCHLTKTQTPIHHFVSSCLSGKQCDLTE